MASSVNFKQPASLDYISLSFAFTAPADPVKESPKKTDTSHVILCTVCGSIDGEQNENCCVKHSIVVAKSKILKSEDGKVIRCLVSTAP